MTDYRANRTYKDSLFRMLFSDKHELLSLYNAISGKNYDNPDDIEINTLQDVIYISVKNDISFVIRDYQLLYEHQSTNNGNMPLRNLFYIANIYSKRTVNKNLYGSSTVKIPNPQFVVFYNGVEEMPERSVQKLSDAFTHNNGPDDIQLELSVIVLNVNEGYNKELMEKCKRLREYTYFVAAVRRNLKKHDIETATELAIEECITNDILADFLRRYKAEVKAVSILEYDAAKHLAFERAEGKVEGKAEKEISLLRNMYGELDVEKIAKFLACEVAYVETLIDLITAYPTETDEELAKRLFVQ
ncbi:MAG: hypothetical protein R3Y47_07465 [Lachnospiraceae bacterium]